MPKVVIESEKRVFDDFFKIDEAHLRYERFNGEMTPLLRRLKFERGDSVAAVIFNPRSRRLVLVNQFRYPTCNKGSGWLVETVAGMIDADETADSALRREVLEETGYHVDRIEHISTFYVSPGGLSERIFLYYAEVDAAAKVARGGGLASENEDVAVIELGFEEALAQIADGRIADAKTIVGIMWLQLRLIGQTGAQPK